MGEGNLLRKLPKVDDLLRREEVSRLAGSRPRPLIRHAVQAAVDGLRESARKGKLDEKALDRIVTGQGILQRIQTALEEFEKDRIARAVNATGVVLHTGLGRAPLGEKAARAAADAAAYTLLEIDRKTGKRGKRERGVEKILQLITGCEAAAAVNNNAAATLLAVSTFARGKQAIVSRGELVEIGGSYRMPDVMKAGHAKLVEVGTTNRTRIADYRNAVTAKTGLLMKVHTSNFRVEGFAEETPLEELVSLGKEEDIPVVHDLGSGLLWEGELPGLEEEPRVRQSLRAGVDLVTFSGDKLLGGPQAGILLGTSEAVGKIRKNPLFRAVRLSKQTLASLEATLESYLKNPDTCRQEIPTLNMLALTAPQMETRAATLERGIASLQIPGLNCTVEPEHSEVGSGSAPGVKLPTHVVALGHERLKPDRLAAGLRNSRPPVFTRVKEDRVLLDPRTLVPGDESLILSSLTQLFTS